MPKRQTYPLVHVVEEVRMLVWQAGQIQKLTDALAWVDDDIGTIVDAETSQALELIGARMAEACKVLRAVITPELQAMIQREEALFARELARIERRERREDRRLRKSREVVSV